MAETVNSTLPAVRESRLDDLARLGTWLALSESGSDSEKAKGAAAALRLYYASELGLPPLAAAELSVIHGRLFVSAQLLRALAERHGYRIQRVDDSDTAATAVLTKGDVELGRSTFTIEDAKRAGLVRARSPWETHPARMCWARASKNVIQDYAPGVALGLSLDDEAAEYTSTRRSEEPIVVHATYVDADDPVEPADEEESKYVAPASVRQANEQRVEEELAKHADLVEE
jgi:hypothetical protein